MDAQTERISQESSALFQELGYKNGILWVQCQLGQIALFRGEEQQAKICFEQSLMLAQQIGNTGCYVYLSLMNLSRIFSRQGELEVGVRLLGAVNEEIQPRHNDPNQFLKTVIIDFGRAVAAAHAQLDEATFAVAYAQGQMMTLDQAVAYALADVAATSQSTFV